MTIFHIASPAETNRHCIFLAGGYIGLPFTEIQLMPKHTPLYNAHIAAGARMVDFGGWEMPINYGSQIEEHHKVRQAAGMFDVSHMTVVDINGAQARHFLSYLLANDVAKLQSPMIASAVLVLPHPDSPTMASTSPSSMSKLT